jgi:uncharacterized cupredoxin-like copper-binding protein/lysophospholipase L1-like esterase
MISPRRIFPAAVAVLSVACLLPTRAQDAAGGAQPVKAADVVPTTLPLSIEKGAHIAILGGTLMERMQAHGWFEGMLFARFAAQQPVVRTLAWPGDEITVQPRPEKYADMHAQLAEVKADVVLAGYGFNESFAGAAGVAQFEADLSAFIAGLRAHRYNGKSAPGIVLISPIAHENLGNPNLPDGREGNARLRLYTEAMERVAKRERTGFVDGFTPSLAAMEARKNAAENLTMKGAKGAKEDEVNLRKKEALTFNGIHLTDAGYRQFGEMLFRGLFSETPPVVYGAMKNMVEEKNRQWLLHYRPLNGFYITGGRAKPYGVVNFPDELKKLEEMTANRDRALWAQPIGKSIYVDDSNTTPLPAITGDRPINDWLSPADELKAFRIDPRFDVNCFASEEDFPELAKPIQMRFDTRGRLWVACSVTYPQVTPGIAPDDKIIILEDTKGTGKADQCTTFATGLSIPLSFEFGAGGVYVSEQPSLVFLKDTDGDGKADLKQIVMTGFGTEDSHHALHDFAWSPDGDLIFRESIFHHSSVETPYGPVRAQDSTFFRFRPATQRLLAFGSYYSTNPWGIVFDDWGWHVGSHPVFASAVHALNPPFPQQHVPAGNFFPAYSGTCGQEFFTGRHFPAELQDCFARVRYKPTNSVEIQRWEEKDTHFEEKLAGHVWESTNLSFIPTDVRCGPRGEMYVCDWYNPVKGHAQYSLRDTRRDKTSGRIWRITAKGRPLVDAPKIAGEPVPALLELLKAPEARTRYLARMELRDRRHDEVRKALDAWWPKLDQSDARVVHHETEALWMYRGIGVTNVDLLVKLLHAKDHQARAAATRELRWAHPLLAGPGNTAFQAVRPAGILPAEADARGLEARGPHGQDARVPRALAFLRERANDESGLVRLEAAIAASYFQSREAAGVALDLLKYPMDTYLTFVLRTALDSLKPTWESDAKFAAEPKLVKFLDESSAKKRVQTGTAAIDPFDKLKPQVVRMGTLHERMMFTITEFKVKAGAPVKLILENPDATPHNLMIVKPGSEDEIGQAANQMATLPGAFEKMDFVPKSEKILQATKMLKQGETDILRFHAPKEPGKYPYICSFPGHYLVMRGVMIVEPTK